MIDERDFDLKTSYEWHTFWVYNDPDFITRCSGLKTPPTDAKTPLMNWRSAYMKLADEFFLTFDDVYRYKRLGINSLKRNKVRSVAVYDERFDWIALYLPKDITEADFRRQWEKVQREKTQINIPSKKRKPPEYHQLVYAVFKERLNHRTFSQIFTDYQDGRLKYYQNKSTTQFKSEDELEKYYRKYEPKKLYS